MGREFELKFAATEEIQAAIAEKFAVTHEITMESTYFDTADRILAQRHITLRRRMENGVSVCTVKTPLSGAGRGEWELEWDDPASMVDELCKLGAPGELKELTAPGLVPVCGARFVRKAATLTVENGTVELALDRGVLIGGGKEIPLCEVEVELKSGDDTAALGFAGLLAEQFGLKQEKFSKFRRAQALANGEE